MKEKRPFTAMVLMWAFAVQTFAAIGGGAPIKAVQLDLARQTETIPFIKSFTAKVAEGGYNTLVLYLEGRVSTASFSIGEGQGYSPDELREVVRHAATCGVDVVPVVSVLGHAEHFFRDGGRDHLSEERGGIYRWPVSEKETFCATQPEAKKFLEAYLREIAEIFPGKNLHLGLDESWQFGFCDTCRKRREEIGFGPLFTEYVTWAHDLCKRLGKRMWMWDDMYEFFPAELEKAPRDIVMCHWIYDDHVTEWGHRGHFLNRVRVDWLAKYEKLGFDALPVGAACPDNLRTLGDYASRHRTLGFFVSQWELKESFYGIPMVNLLGVDRVFPSLNEQEKLAIESLAARWSYSSSRFGVSLSRIRHRGKLVADAAPDIQALKSIRLALDVLRASKLTPGKGEVSYDPLSERALLDDIVMQFETMSYWAEIDLRAPHIISPRRTAAESAKAKEELRALLPHMREIRTRREKQQQAWRPDRTPNLLADPISDHVDYIAKLLAQKDVAAEDEWVLGLSLSLPDFHGIPNWTVSGLFADGWKVIATGVYKPDRGDWANFERKISFKASAPPTKLRFDESGYGEGLLLYASVWNRSRRYVPQAVTGTEGIVVDPANILKDDWRPVRFGFQDRAPIFSNPDLSHVISTLECTMFEETSSK